MFLVDKYQKDSNYITCHQDIIDKLLDTFDSHQKIHKMSKHLKNKSNKEFKKIINELETKSWRYSNLQHLVLYIKIILNLRRIVTKKYFVNYVLTNTKLFMT